jgi:tripartite-type tricarboxylate transporter receptor subunit TctC
VLWLLRRARERDVRALWLLAFALPMPLFFLCNAPMMQVKPNWIAPSYLPLLLGASLWFSESGIQDRKPKLAKAAKVALLAVLPSLLMVHPSIPAKTVREFIALGKTRPGALTYASTGNGTSPHMMMEMLSSMAGMKLVHVPYKGASPAMIDQISGQIDAAFSTAIAALPFVQKGKVRAIAVSTRERFPPLPNLPTVDESGLKGFEATTWFGVMAPLKTPRDIITRLNADLARIVASPEVRDRFIGEGVEPIGGPPELFGGFIRDEIDKYAKVVKAANIKAE